MPSLRIKKSWENERNKSLHTWRTNGWLSNNLVLTVVTVGVTQRKKGHCVCIGGLVVSRHGKPLSSRLKFKKRARQQPTKDIWTNDRTNITIDVLHPDLADDAVHVSQRLPAVYSVTDGVGWSSSTASIGVFKFVFSCKWPWRTFSALQRTNRRGILPKDNVISRTILFQREATKKLEDTCLWWVCPFAKWHVLAHPEYSGRFQCNVMQCFLWVYLVARIAQLVDW